MSHGHFLSVSWVQAWLQKLRKSLRGQIPGAAGPVGAQLAYSGRTVSQARGWPMAHYTEMVPISVPNTAPHGELLLDGTACDLPTEI